jgi:LysR family hydrogen peroxide-inducible transcriptional activator
MVMSPHPMTLRQLQYAVAVAELASFRRAADRCRVAQPSLSTQIAALEEALGVTLFERDRRGVRTTRAGQAIVEQARRVLVAAGDVVDAARRHADPLAGRLRVGVLPTLSPYVLPRIAPALRRAFPRLAIAWTEDRTAALVEAVRSGALDAALVAREADLGGLHAEPVARDEFVLAAPRGHALARDRAPARVEDLAGADVLVLDEGHCLGAQALAVCTAAGADRAGLRATSLPTLVQMVAAGEGVTLLPALAAAAEARAARVVLRPFVAPAPARTVALAWREGAATEPALRRIADELRRALAPRGSRAE